MLVLAVDTTSRGGSVAIVRDGRVVGQHLGDRGVTHGQRLPGDVIDICASAGVSVHEVDLFAVAAGPGSFTGLRIGIATVQGLAMACARRVVPISTLEAIAAAAPDGAARVSAWMDAQRGEVFAQVFECLGGDARPLTEAIAAPPERVLALHANVLEGAGFEGDGAVRYREVIDTLREHPQVASVARPLAGAIGQLATRHPGRAVLPHAIVPIYVRRPDAVIARDRGAAGS